MDTVHLVIAIGTGLLVLYADEQAFLWVLGKRALMDEKRVRVLHHAVTSGLALLLLTGGYMYAQAAPAYLSIPTFVVKMATVLALILNTYAIGRFSSVALTRPFASLSHAERLPLFITGAISFLGWVTAFVCGLLIA